MTRHENAPAALIDQPAPCTDESAASDGRPQPHFAPAPLRLRMVTLAMVILPFAGLVLAMVLLWHVAFSWLYLALLGAMYVTTAMGVTIGFHRLFTHRSFKSPHPVRWVLGVMGSMAVQGPVLTWVAVHRRHHQHSDDHGDPHSPHLHGDTVIGAIRGFIHSHVGWMFGEHPDDLMRYSNDLRRDKVMTHVNRWFVLWVILGLAIPAALGGLLTGSWAGAALGFIWGGLVRVFLGHHLTWSINSVCHLWGSRAFEVSDESRNNAIFGVLAFGEGWHNNHHAFPNSARHGLRWWQVDVSYLIIRAMGALGIAREIRVPSRDRLQAKRAGRHSHDAPATDQPAAA